MAQILSAETMERVNVAAQELARVANEEAAVLTFTGDGATDEGVEQARAVNAVVIAVSGILQTMPLNQLGVIVAMASTYGTVLGQCEGDRNLLHKAFQRQVAATLAEIAAARMKPMGTA